MAKKKVILTFPAALSEKAITYRLVKDFDLAINILRARITPGETGRLVIEMANGSQAAIDQGIAYLQEQGVKVEQLSQEISLSDKCVDCGACTAVCPTGALAIGAPDWKLHFDKEKCILCGVCVSACPMKAIKVVF